MGEVVNHDNTKRLVRILMGGYPNFKPSNLADTINVWEKTLQGEDYELIENTLLAYMRSDSSGFAPSPGQLISYKNSIVMDDGLTEGEAWALVSKALSDSLYHAKERYAELPKSIQKALGDPSTLRELAKSEDGNTVVQSNFLRLYRNSKQRMVADASISPALRNLISSCADKLAIPVEREKDYYYPMMNEPEV